MNPSPANLAKLTDLEWAAINDARVNLSDAHARQAPVPVEQAIIDRLPELFARSSQVTQREIEAAFKQNFFRLAGQPSVEAYEHAHFIYAATLGMGVAAIYLATHGKSLALLSPTFDNIPDTLRHHRIVLEPLAEGSLGRLGDDVEVASDAIFLVLPNNPTGFELDETGFRQVVDYCVAESKTLIVDFCFRFFSRQLHLWDQYAYLLQSGVDFICYEDSGKTWPTQDLKCSMILTSPSLEHEVEDIVHDILLNVSPVILLLVDEFITSEVFPLVRARGLIDRNRDLLTETMVGLGLEELTRTTAMPIAWLGVEGRLTGLELVAMARTVGVHLTPGEPFFWDDRSRGRRFVRLALARDTDYLKAGLSALRRVLLGWQQHLLPAAGGAGGA